MIRNYDVVLTIWMGDKPKTIINTFRLEKSDSYIDKIAAIFDEVGLDANNPIMFYRIVERGDAR